MNKFFFKIREDMLKKLILMIITFTNHNFAFALFKIEFINYSNLKIYFIHYNLANSQSTFEIPSEFVSELQSLDSGEKLRLKPLDHIILENKYKISFTTQQTECSWIHIFSKKKKAHGWDISIYVNDKHKGTICANKKSILDYEMNARLSFLKDLNHISFLQFYNLGWWPNDSIFPNSLNVKLE